MKRQNSIKTITAGSFGSLLIGNNRGNKRIDNRPVESMNQPPGMVVGCQSRTGTSAQDLEFLARHGVFHMGPGSPISVELDTGIYTPDDEGFQHVPWDLDIALRYVEAAPIDSDGMFERISYWLE